MAFLRRKPEADPADVRAAGPGWELRATQSGWEVFKDWQTGTMSHAGVTVTQDNATNLPAVYRCVTLNTDTVSTMPVNCYRKQGDKRTKIDEPLWMEESDDAFDFPRVLGQLQASLELDGNAFALKASDNNGRLTGLLPIPPQSVTCELLSSGQMVYRVHKEDGQDETFASTAILHIPGFMLPGAERGMSPITAARQSIGLGLAAEQFGGQFFGNGATMSGIIKMPGEQPTGDKLTAIQEQFKRKHGGLSKSHAVGILGGGADWIKLSVTPEESQFLETRKFTDVQIANIFGVPAEYVTEAEGAKGYVTGIYARQYMWLQTGINPRLVRMERALTKLLAGKDTYVKFNRNSFLAMDPTERKDFYNAGLIGRWIVPNEIREKEEMDPLPFGDVPLWSVQWGPNPYSQTPPPAA